MRLDTGTATPLLVVHGEPQRLRPLIAAHVGAYVSFREPDHDGKTPARCGSSSEILHLRVDGPASALGVVAAGLRRHEPDTLIVVSAPENTPPPWFALDILADHALHPGVDLHDVRWTSKDLLWWTGRWGPRTVPLPTDQPCEGAQAAQILLSTTAPEDDSPVADWLRALTRRERPDDLDWDLVLCAQYITATAERLAQHGGGRSSDDPAPMTTRRD